MRLPTALLLLECRLLFSTSTFSDMSESMRFSTDCVLACPPWMDDLINSLTFLLMDCEFKRRFWTIGWTVLCTDDEIVGIFESLGSLLGPSLRLIRLMLRLILFLKALATRKPTALEYEGGGEYFGGASSIASVGGWLETGTITGSAIFAPCWHNRLIGKCEFDGSGISMGGLNKSSMRCKRKYF